MKKILFISLLSLLCVGCNMNSSSNSINSLENNKNEVYQLFEHKENETEMDYFYNYCPTSFEEDGVRHIYYCANKIHGNVTDYIVYRKGIKDNNGS